MAEAKTFSLPRFKVGERIWTAKRYTEMRASVFGRISERWRRRCSTYIIQAIHITLKKERIIIQYEVGDYRTFFWAIDENEVFKTKEECQEWMRKNK